VLRAPKHLNQDNTENEEVSPTWTLLCFPPKKIFVFGEDKYSKCDEKYVPDIDWKSAKIFNLRDGIYCTIFQFEQGGVIELKEKEGFESEGWRVVSNCGQSMYAKQFCQRYAFHSFFFIFYF
jgi:hypothetical protein